MKSAVFRTSLPVPLDGEEDFLAAYSRITTHLEKARGFVSASVHRGITSPVAHTYHFHVEWENSRGLLDALGSSQVAGMRSRADAQGAPAAAAPVEF